MAWTRPRHQNNQAVISIGVQRGPAYRKVAREVAAAHGLLDFGPDLLGYGGAVAEAPFGASACDDDQNI